MARSTSALRASADNLRVLTGERRLVDGRTLELPTSALRTGRDARVILLVPQHIGETGRADVDTQETRMNTHDSA